MRPSLASSGQNHYLKMVAEFNDPQIGLIIGNQCGRTARYYLSAYQDLRTEYYALLEEEGRGKASVAALEQV